MSRGFRLPYQASNPRTVRGAKKRGWHVVKCGSRAVRNGEVVASWLGLNIWADCNCGYFVSSFALGTFAFENASDAMIFQLKWT